MTAFTEVVYVDKLSVCTLM